MDAGFRARKTEGDNNQSLVKRGQPGSDASLCSNPNPTNTSIRRSVMKKELNLLNQERIKKKKERYQENFGS